MLKKSRNFNHNLVPRGTESSIGTPRRTQGNVQIFFKVRPAQPRSLFAAYQRSRKAFSTVLIPLSTSSMGVEEKTMMINKFLESIPVHQEKARQTSAAFADLVHDVEIFPNKVNRYLAQAESEETSGFWATLWKGLKQYVLF
jgi:hypothetical protein